jgi:hypothetical protein
MKTKTKKAEAKKLSKKLYNLLSDAEVISDGERMFWLDNFSNISESAQLQLVEIVNNGERELQKEKDAHQARVAEIDTKCVAQLQEMAAASGLKASAGEDSDADYDEDEIIKTLKQAGEL